MATWHSGNNPSGRCMLNAASAASSHKPACAATKCKLPHDVWTRMTCRQKEAYLCGKNASRNQTCAPPKGKGSSAIIETIRFNSKNSSNTGKGSNVAPFHMKQGETKPKSSPWRTCWGAQSATNVPKAMLKAVHASPCKIHSKEIVCQTKKQGDCAPLELKNSKCSCCTAAWEHDGTVDKKPTLKKNKVQHEPPAFNCRMLLDGIAHKIENKKSPKSESQKKNLPKTQIPVSEAGKTETSKDCESNGWTIIDDAFALCNHAAGNWRSCVWNHRSRWLVNAFGIANKLFPKCIEKHLEENPGFHAAFKKEIEECINIAQELLIEQPEEDLEQLKLQNKAKCLLEQEEKRINLKNPSTPQKHSTTSQHPSQDWTINWWWKWCIVCWWTSMAHWLHHWQTCGCARIHKKTSNFRCANWRRNHCTWSSWWQDYPPKG